MVKVNKPTILIAEDDEIILRALYLAFHEGDYTIVTANDGDQALRITERIKPDLVLLDLLMPKMSGIDYLKNLRANPALKFIPVVVLSNLDDADDINKAKDLGAKAFFVKSSTELSVLTEKVREILGT